MIVRLVASLMVAALAGSLFVSTSEAGLFGRRAYRPHFHHAPVAGPSYDHPASFRQPVRVIPHVNQPYLFLNESGYGES